MSDENKDQDIPADAAVEAELEKTEKSPGKGPRKWLGFAIVTIVVLALLAIAWFMVADMQSKTSADESADSIARMSAELTSARETVNALNSRIGEQQEALRAERERISALENALSSIEDKISRPTDLLGSVPARVASLERGLASLQGISEGTRDNWLLAEAEYFLQVANVQAELARNPILAAAALRQADERVAELSNPAYTAVRAAIADELAALSQIADADVAGMTLTLASLSRVVDSLPVKQDEKAAEESAVIDPEATGVARAWGAIKDTASGLFTVTRPGEERSPLLTPESESLLRANLSLQIQAARLALLKGEQQVFVESLRDADDWLETYFDTQSVQVQSARRTLDDIRKSPAMRELPDISSSLAQLRRLRTLGNSERAETVDGDSEE